MDEDRRESWEQDELEINNVRSWGDETFGDSEPGPLYRCPEHGLIYAGDVIWKRDGRPYCPKADCDEPLERVD